MLSVNPIQLLSSAKNTADVRSRTSNEKRPSSDFFSPLLKLARAKLFAI